MAQEIFEATVQSRSNNAEVNGEEQRVKKKLKSNTLPKDPPNTLPKDLFAISTTFIRRSLTRTVVLRGARLLPRLKKPPRTKNLPNIP
jgi:hypothetical protein